MNKFSVVLMGGGIFIGGVAIVMGNPLTSIVLGWIWIVWGVITITTAVTAKNIKWWDR